MTSLGFQASSLKPYLTTQKDLLYAFHRLSDMGYKYLQLQWIDAAVPLEYTAQALQETGLTCIATQDGFEAVRDNFDYYLRMNTLWGSKSLCVSAIPKEQMSPEGLVAFAAQMKSFAKALGKQNLSLTFHPLSYNFRPVNGISALDTVMELMPREVGLTFCIMQAVQAGIDPVSILERYRGRIEICHFKDYVISPDGKTYLTPVGQGQIDWPPIFEACRRTGVAWGLAEQESWQKDAFDCARESFDYISSHGILP